jgi:hypothetical protein
MPTKNINTNTNINKININIPKTRTVYRKPRQTKQTQEQVNSAEEKLSNLENMDSQFVNPSVFGFNRTPLYIPEPIQQVQNRIMEQPTKTTRGTQTSPMTVEEEKGKQPTSPISFSSASPVQAEVFSPRPVMGPVNKTGFQSMGTGLKLPSDFEARLSTQEGFQPVQPMSSPFSMYQNPNLANAILRRTSMETGPNINELRTRIFGVKPTGVTNTTPISQPASPMEIVVKKGKGGRPKGGKNKPKPITTETQTGASLNPPVEKPKAKTVKRTINMADVMPTPKTALRGQQPKIEEID